jgi:S-adenosylmethionine:tRNA ribosyltransferase-isomerase
MKVGTILTFREGITLEIEEHTDAGRIILIRGTDIYSLMEEYGQLPLPPYIEYSSEKESDYQTRFAEKDGSVAAPTASLHFTDELLSGIQAQKEYITLHVGLGTFK